MGMFERKMCTGIISNTSEGTVYHVRNLDFGTFVEPLQYNANYIRNGSTVYQGINVAGFLGTLTAFKMGFYAIELNTRFPDHIGGNIQMFKNYLQKKTPLITWLVRKQLESNNSYD